MDLKIAHRLSIHHREEVERSERCACFHCLAVFPPSAIQTWTDQDTTAMCPACGIDAVLASASGAPMDVGFLRGMRKRWFRC